MFEQTLEYLSQKTIRRILIIVYLEIFDRFLFDFLENYKYNEERTSSKSA